jgi:hypothetical protein
MQLAETGLRGRARYRNRGWLKLIRADRREGRIMRSSAVPSLPANVPLRPANFAIGATAVLASIGTMRGFTELRRAMRSRLIGFGCRADVRQSVVKI